MTANRSLDDFAAREEPAADAPEPTDGPADADVELRSSDADDAAATDGTEPSPPTVTYAWSPGGAPCASCGEPAAARWRDGAELVCPDCKAW